MLPSDVLLPICNLHTFHVPVNLLIIVQLEKRLNIRHGLLNVLTKPSGILQVTQTKKKKKKRETDHSGGFMIEQKLSFCELTVSGLENLLEMWNVMRFSPIMM